MVGIESLEIARLASAGILGKEREPGVGKLGWHGFKGILLFRSKSRVRVF